MPASTTLTRSFKPWLLGVLCGDVLVGSLSIYMRPARPDLQPWHTQILAGEFRAGDEDRIKTIAD